MSSSAPLLSGTIEADEDAPQLPKGSIGSSTKSQTQRAPELLVPGTQANGSTGQGNTGSAEEGGIVRRIPQAGASADPSRAFSSSQVTL